jgi:hypothetical protein
MDAAFAQLGKLEAQDPADEDVEGNAGYQARRASLAALRDLDASLLERSVVGQLAKLGTKEADIKATEERIDQIRDRGCEWIASREMPRESKKTAEAIAKNITMHMRRLRALLHIVDGDIDVEDDQARSDKLRARWVKTASELVAHFGRNPPPALRRMLLATLARALDALIRVDACDVADAFLMLSLHMEDVTAFDALAEASMDLDLSQLASVRAFADAFLKEFDRLDILVGGHRFHGCDHGTSIRRRADFFDRLEIMQHSGIDAGMHVIGHHFFGMAFLKAPRP